IVATNRNDILHRFMSGNRYNKDELHPTLSPSMGIMVSSNSERLLFDMHGRDGAKGAGLMEQLRATGEMSVAEARWTETRTLSDSLAVDDEHPGAGSGEVYKETGELRDPHTAIGVRAAGERRRSLAIPMVALSTAHPVKS